MKARDGPMALSTAWLSLIVPTGTGGRPTASAMAGAGLYLPVEDPLHGHGAPGPTTGGRDATAGQPLRNLAQ